MKIFFLTLNPCECRKLNIDQYKEFLSANNHTHVTKAKDADIIMVWSCGFREDYLKRSKDVINKLKEKFRKKIVVTGCLPDIDNTGLENADIIVPWRQEEKGLNDIFANTTSLDNIKKQYCVPKLIDNLEDFKKSNPDQDASFSDQFVKLFVSEGCSLKCSYCSERLMFPEYKSFPIDEIIESCRRILKDSKNETIIIQGDNPGAYGIDNNSSLPELMDRLYNEFLGIKIGVANLHPIYFLQYIEKFKEYIKNGTLAHTRIPIQSASDRILTLMQRGYSKIDIENIFNTFLSYNFFDFSTDIIVGFPSESDEDFNESLEFVLRFKPTYINLSRFMSLKMVKAFSIEQQVSEESKTSRLLKAGILFSAEGLFCNQEDGDHVKDRQNRMIKY